MPEDVQYSHPSDIPGLTLSTARFAEFRFEPHYHLDCHIALVASGVQRQSFRGESLLLTRGAIQLMPQGEVHDGIAGANESYTLQTFRLSPALLDGFGEEITGKHYFPSQAAVVLQDSRLADELLKVHVTLQRGTTDRMLNETYVLELLESLFARLKQPTPLTITGNLSSEQLHVVRDFVEAHISDKIVLEDLSLLIGLDRFRFLKLFKRTVGMTPHAWLLRLRLEKAIALINASRNMSITEVAHAVGFFDQSHFTRTFRQAYGVTPARF
ncbi:helix-turn-helix transcriptional regulator [Paraburkholderia antibiotica]|uniref:AraC family transcriptional regulator n=1 Tax=Paraburkholderia antibiotica TaxID=2728839 RepID=A0A7X9X496_9BURK|nr:AraC family transcriptional regulator [Paraburkholderia antibiotica]NML31168.1 AraC family transcriptional regulator [Paraburkholderia antibiotica]